MEKAVAVEKTATSGAGTKEKKRSLWKILLLAFNILLFLSGVIFFLIMKFEAFQDPAVTEAIEETGQEALDTKSKEALQLESKESKAPLVSISLQPFTVNLSGESRNSYLRLTLQLQVGGEEAKAEMEKRTAEIQNHLIFLLSSKSFAEISTIQGKYKLQEEIKRTLNAIVGKPVVEKVYFTEFIVQ